MFDIAFYLRYSTFMRILTKDTLAQVGESVILKGWVDNRRDHGKLIFIDLRDRSGMVQVVFSPADAALLAKAAMLRDEWVIELRGLVKERPAKMGNPDLGTGMIEIAATELIVLNEAGTPPISVQGDGYDIGEEHRLHYRYLDLRRTRLQNNMILRDQVISFIRHYLHEKDFIEIETPILTKSTPEGARDYVVPSRIYPGNFYALPQSPQQYKQLLMTAGFERYFQIARCFRDEDTRGDRQPEFTQLDVEMSFVEREDVMRVMEELMIALVKACVPKAHILNTPFPRLTYAEARERYGSDRPDLRLHKDDPYEFSFCWVVDFPSFEKDEKTGAWTFSHNPFSSPKPEHREFLREGRDLGSIISQQYDITLNGYEIGGGSIRLHDAALLQSVFKILGYSSEEIQTEFGHMLTAFQHGTPPHGGIAWGLDRLLMLFAGEPNIREVIAFPKTGDARDLMMGAPAKLSEAHWRELHFTLKKGDRSDV